MIRRVALVAAVVACATAPAAAAFDRTSQQVASLASRARSDPRALAVLRTVDRVDGRPVNMFAALDTTGPELDARLQVLAASGGAKPVNASATDPRSSAQKILDERRFHGSDVPRPLHGPLHWLGQELRRLYEAIARPLPGGDPVLGLILATLVAAAAALVAQRLARRVGGLQIETAGRSPRTAAGDDPRRLEREAEQAEREGAFERALRLRFQAGLLRLAHADAIPQQTALTNGQIARRLRSSSFRELASDFDEVVYGDRTAGIGEVERARERWPRVVQEAGRR